METINPIIYIYIVEEKKHKFYNIYEMFKIQFLRDKRWKQNTFQECAIKIN